MHDTLHSRTGDWHPHQPAAGRALRVGIGGPVGSGKTALVEYLCIALRDDISLAVVTNDIFTDEDARMLVTAEALPAERIIGVETGGCPHTAIREDASMNLEAVEQLETRFPGLELVFIESGGDNLAAAFSPELADRFIYIIDVAQGENIPRKGGPGISRSDLLIINKSDLAPHVGADLNVMVRDAQAARGERPHVLCSIRHDDGASAIVDWLRAEYNGTGANAAAPAAAHAARHTRA